MHPSMEFFIDFVEREHAKHGVDVFQVWPCVSDVIGASLHSMIPMAIQTVGLQAVAVESLEFTDRAVLL